MRIRRHCSGYIESMETTEEVSSMAEVVAYINKQWELDPGITASQVIIEPYSGIDERNGWDTWIVCVDGRVFGMSDGPLPDPPK